MRTGRTKWSRSWRCLGGRLGHAAEGSVTWHNLHGQRFDDVSPIYIWSVHALGSSNQLLVVSSRGGGTSAET